MDSYADPMPARRTSGFTLVEIMVVIAILGGILALVPVNYGNWGSRSRLESAGNSMVAAITSTRFQAIFDGYDAFLEFGRFRKTDDDSEPFGYRIKFTSVRQVLESGNEDEDQENREKEQVKDREWLYTEWHEMPEGCEITGVSKSKGQWQKVSVDRPFILRFDPSGNVEQAVAVRIENKEMDVSQQYRTITVTVNGLTSTATWQKGEKDLVQIRPASDFGG